MVVLHGSGLNGPNMARWSGLAESGPNAGFLTVFPDALDEIWDDQGLGRVDGADDAGFVAELIEHLVGNSSASANGITLVGLSNGAFFAERLARHGLVRSTSLVLVAGTAREVSRRSAPAPANPTPVLLFEGTADPLVPYQGGAASGPMAWLARRRARRHLVSPGRRESVGAETIAADWAATNRCHPIPAVDLLATAARDAPVERLTWSAPQAQPVVLYKINGGGHGWPGGPQYVPAVLVGRIPRHLDATRILLDFVHR
ncbi:MAG: alpha/beta hydrolase family esterase [Candidatus Dormibacterales bacterium]